MELTGISNGAYPMGIERIELSEGFPASDGADYPRAEK